MSVVSVNEHSAGGGADDSGHRNWWVKYLVRTDSKSDGPITVMFDELSPGYGSGFGYGFDADPLATRKSANVDLVEEESTRKVWMLTVNFSTHPVARPDTALFAPGSSGTSDPTTISKLGGSFLPYAEAVVRDIDGDEVKNTAGDLFLDLTADRNRPTLAIEKTYTLESFATIYPTLCSSLSTGAVNEGTWWYQAARKWKLSAAPWQLLYYGDARYCSVSYSFEMKEETWDLKPANRGPRYKAGTKWFRFADDKGLDYGGDGLGALNVDGNRRASDADPILLFFDDDLFNGVLAPFEIYGADNFSATYSIPSGLT